MASPRCTAGSASIASAAAPSPRRSARRSRPRRPRPGREPMKVALVNPSWRFDGSIYFGCRDPHLPLEYGYARQMLEAAGHEARIVDGQLFGLSPAGIRRAVESFGPDMTVVTTAPS